MSSSGICSRYGLKAHFGVCGHSPSPPALNYPPWGEVFTEEYRPDVGNWEVYPNVGFFFSGKGGGIVRFVRVFAKSFQHDKLSQSILFHRNKNL